MTDKLPLESCETMNGTWGYNINDKKFKNKKELIHLLAGAAGRNTNLLLNIGPMPSGRIQEAFKSSLKEVGPWVSVNGEAIYGTRKGPVSPRVWGVTTQNDKKVFVHLFENPKDGSIYIPGDYKKQAKVLVSGKSVPLKWEKDGIHLDTSKLPEVEADLVLVLLKS